MMNKKKILSCALSFALFASAGLNTYAAGFTDTENHWSASFVERACAENIVSGYPGGVFKPDAKVSHQEAMTMVCKTVESVLPGKLNMNKADSYRSMLLGLDFDPSWALPFGAALFDAGAAYKEDFSGTAKDPAARQTIGAWMVRAFDLPIAPLCETDCFTDMSSIASRYFGEAWALKHYGLMTGYVDGSLGPANQVTRAEFATVCVNTLDSMAKLSEKNGKHKLADCLFLKTGTIQSIDSKTNAISFSWGGSYCVPADALIIVDGSYVDFASLASYSGQNLVVSFLYDQQSTLVIQTKPLAESGKVKSVAKEGDFYNIGILTGSGHVVNYALSMDSGFKVPAEGAKVSFIAQGVEILEII